MNNIVTTRFSWLYLCVLAVTIIASGQSIGATTETGDSPGDAGRPNVLILLTDDQRFDAVNALGDKQIRTPYMDSLVQRGITFRNSYIMGSLHGAVCMPSRAMLLTGRSYFTLPMSVTITWNVKNEQRGDCPHITMPELFRQAGYQTFGTGKWHNGRSLYAKGFTDGAEIFFGGMSDHLKVPAYDFDPAGVYPGDKKKVRDTFSSELFSDAAVEFLKTRDRTKPFFAYVSYTAPHDPRMAPAEYESMYPPDTIDLPPNFKPEHPFDIADQRIRDEKLAPFPRTPEVVREHIAGYYAMMTHLDAHIGRIQNALEETGDLDNTIIVFTSDNGLAVGQHGLLGKQNLYEHSARVPLVICGPDIPVGAQRGALSYVHDVFPTLCDLTGLDVPESVQSHSLVPMMTDPSATVRDSVYLSYSPSPMKLVEGKPQPPSYQRGIRVGDWKLIQSHFKGTVTHLLFNLRDDPWEVQNLADDPAQAERLESMRLQLRDLARQEGDIAPIH